MTTFTMGAMIMEVVRDPVFEVGDVVCLKSGGPRMTVSTINLDNRLRTIWFDIQHHYQFDFEQAVL